MFEHVFFDNMEILGFRCIVDKSRILGFFSFLACIHTIWFYKAEYKV